jgi:hypothetical protein
MFFLDDKLLSLWGVTIPILVDKRAFHSSTHKVKCPQHPCKGLNVTRCLPCLGYRRNSDPMCMHDCTGVGQPGKVEKITKKQSAAIESLTDTCCTTPIGRFHDPQQLT